MSERGALLAHAHLSLAVLGFTLALLAVVVRRRQRWPQLVMGVAMVPALTAGAGRALPFGLWLTIVVATLTAAWSSAARAHRNCGSVLSAVELLAMAVLLLLEPPHAHAGASSPALVLPPGAHQHTVAGPTGESAVLALLVAAAWLSFALSRCTRRAQAGHPSVPHPGGHARSSALVGGACSSAMAASMLAMSAMALLPP
ncbi:hypothetical protein GTQ99_02235 [Kineococcus sp. T13]|uniref:hypothetical protein n=1 Tax=Kineococcus vitellinus TaxID=2696565 RepID=UPI001411EDF3|nr:hypothetical protein [Kineococcus vitellinus]NAZ74248.1 hypothetical protein [Kineococcus vitellinus]